MRSKYGFCITLLFTSLWIKSINFWLQACYCSICETMLTSSGFFCECCGACSDTMCIQMADKALKCKNKYAEDASYVSGQNEPIVASQPHLWVKGNLPLNCVCTVCDRDIDYHGKPGLYGYRCCWCQRATHTNCFPRTVDDKVSHSMRFLIGFRDIKSSLFF